MQITVELPAIIPKSRYQIAEQSEPSSFNEKDRRHYLLLLEKVQSSPKKALQEAKDFYERHQDKPESWNLLAYVLIQKKKIKDADKLMEECMRRFPNYLLGRINYADQMVRKKKYDAVPWIFPTFDLKELFPDKKTFALNEVRGFFVLLGNYYLGLGQKENALYFLELLKQIDPNHPSVLFLEKRILSKIPFWKKILQTRIRD